MKKFHVILADELGEEFSAQVTAHDLEEAWEVASNCYPESCVVSVRLSLWQS